MYREHARQRAHKAPPRSVVIVPPAVGPAPVPPAALTPALDLLYTLHVGPRDLRDAATDAALEALRVMVSAVCDASFRPRAYGLSGRETQAWLAQVRTLLTDESLVALRDYTAACCTWNTALRAVVTDDAADPDWDMTSARGVWPNPAEQRLAAALAAAGLPVQAQVGVSKFGGRRRGGWFASYWLDCAHRDVRYGLRLDIELDGKEHLYGDRPARDAQRNHLLRQRGWYIVRIPGSVLYNGAFAAAVAAVVALAERHRRAVVLARSEVTYISRALAAVQVPTQQALFPPKPSATLAPPQTTPACPQCGQALVQRTARKGPQAGQHFYGCAAYPQCRYTQAV